jgi:hypothetical protein
MPQNHDYIPKTDADLLTFVKNMYAYALVHASRWGVPSSLYNYTPFPAIRKSPRAAISSPVSAWTVPRFHPSFLISGIAASSFA